MRILLIRLSSLGDVVMTVPAVNALVACNQNAEIDYLTSENYKEVIKSIPGINSVLTIDKQALAKLKLKKFADLFHTINELINKNYDIVVDFQAYNETGMLAKFTDAPIRIGRGKGSAMYFTHYLGSPDLSQPIWRLHFEMLAEIDLIPKELINKAPEYFRLQTSPEVKEKINTWFETEQIRKNAFKLGLFTSASRPQKCWDYLHFLDFIELIAEKFDFLEVIFLGGLNDEKDKSIIFNGFAARHSTHRFEYAFQREQYLATKSIKSFDDRVRIHWFSAPTLLEIVEITSQLDAFVSNDTGPYHLAVMSGVQTLGLFQRHLPDFFPPAPHRTLIAPNEDMSKLEPQIVAAEFLNIFTNK